MERSPAKPGVLVVTYIADHYHAVPTHINALAGTARNTPQSPLSDDTRKRDEEYSADVSSSVAADTGADGDSELWAPGEMDDMFGAFDDDFDHFFGDGDVFGRSVSL